MAQWHKVLIILGGAFALFVPLGSQAKEVVWKHDCGILPWDEGLPDRLRWNVQGDLADTRLVDGLLFDWIEIKDTTPSGTIELEPVEAITSFSDTWAFKIGIARPEVDVDIPGVDYAMVITINDGTRRFRFAFAAGASGLLDEDSGEWMRDRSIGNYPEDMITTYLLRRDGDTITLDWLYLGYRVYAEYAVTWFPQTGQQQVRMATTPHGTATVAVRDFGFNTQAHDINYSNAARLGVRGHWLSDPLLVDFMDFSQGSPIAWHWDFGDGTTSTEQNPEHRYELPGVYEVVLTPEYEGICGNPAEETVDVCFRYIGDPSSHQGAGGILTIGKPMVTRQRFNVCPELAGEDLQGNPAQARMWIEDTTGNVIQEYPSLELIYTNYNYDTYWFSSVDTFNQFVSSPDLAYWTDVFGADEITFGRDGDWVVPQATEFYVVTEVTIGESVVTKSMRRSAQSSPHARRPLRLLFSLARGSPSIGNDFQYIGNEGSVADRRAFLEQNAAEVVDHLAAFFPVSHRSDDCMECAQEIEVTIDANPHYWSLSAWTGWVDFVWRAEVWGDYDAEFYFVPAGSLDMPLLLERDGVGIGRVAFLDERAFEPGGREGLVAAHEFAHLYGFDHTDTARLDEGWDVQTVYFGRTRSGVVKPETNFMDPSPSGFSWLTAEQVYDMNAAMAQRLTGTKASNLESLSWIGGHRSSNTDGVIYPAFSRSTRFDLQSPLSGQYVLRMLGASAEVLLEIVPSVFPCHDCADSNAVVFGANASIPPGTTRIDLVDGTEVVASREASMQVPSVSTLSVDRLSSNDWNVSCEFGGAESDSLWVLLGALRGDSTVVPLTGLIGPVSAGTWSKTLAEEVLLGDGNQQLIVSVSNGIQSENVIRELPVPTGIRDLDARQDGPKLSINVTPNPFNPHVTVQFQLEHAGLIALDVYSIAGRKIATLRSERFGAGSHTVSWDGLDADGRAVASGVYLFRLESGGKEIVARGVLLK